MDEFDIWVRMCSVQLRSENLMSNLSGGADSVFLCVFVQDLDPSVGSRSRSIRGFTKFRCSGLLHRALLISIRSRPLLRNCGPCSGDEAPRITPTLLLYLGQAKRVATVAWLWSQNLNSVIRSQPTQILDLLPVRYPGFVCKICRATLCQLGSNMSHPPFLTCHAYSQHRLTCRSHDLHRSQRHKCGYRYYYPT